MRGRREPDDGDRDEKTVGQHGQTYRRHRQRGDEEAALSLGANGWQTFFRVTLPNIKWGLLYGVLLCNARAMGEFGATLMVAGSIPGRTQTLSIDIYEAVQAGQDGKANALVILTSVVCIVILLLAARLVGGRRRELRDVA